MVMTMLFALALQVFAPHQGEPPRVPVTLALVDEIPEPNAKAVIVRQAGSAPRDLILLRRNQAGAQIFSAAIAAYLVSRVDFEAAPGRDFRILVLSDKGPDSWEREHGKFVAILGYLRTVPPVTVPGIGSAQTTEIWVKPIIPTRVN